MQFGDWPSLPSELVHSIARCLLDTNDLDLYMDFRAVCTAWLSATDDPKDNPNDLRFRPCRWTVIDEVFRSDSRLLVNTATGRVVRKELPLLRRYLAIATAHGGFFVLADREPPHATLVLNPFTGHIVPTRRRCRSTWTFLLPLSPVLRRQCSSCSSTHSKRCSTRLLQIAMMASLRTETRSEERFGLTRLAVTGGVCADGVHRTVPNNVFCVMGQFFVDPYELFFHLPATGFADIPGAGHAGHFFLIYSAVEFLAIIKVHNGLNHLFDGRQPKAFRLGTGGDDAVEPVKSIGGRAIFVGNYHTYITFILGQIKLEFDLVHRKL